MSSADVRMKKIFAIFLAIFALWELGQLRLALSAQAFGYNLVVVFFFLLLIGTAHRLWNGNKPQVNFSASTATSSAVHSATKLSQKDQLGNMKRTLLARTSDRIREMLCTPSDKYRD